MTQWSNKVRQLRHIVGFAATSALMWFLILTILAAIGVEIFSISFYFNTWLPAGMGLAVLPAGVLTMLSRRVNRRPRPTKKVRPSRRRLAVYLLLPVTMLGLAFSPMLHEFTTRASAAESASLHFELMDSQPVSEGRIERTLAEFERARPEILSQWGVSPDPGPRIRVAVFSDVSQMHQIVGTDAWAAGATACLPDGPLIVVPAEQAGNLLSETAPTTTPRHEMVHAAMCLALGPETMKSIPSWFHEGTARLSEWKGFKQWTPRALNAWTVWLQRKRILDPATFCNYVPGDLVKEVGLFYATSFEFYRFLADQYGEEMLRGVAQRSKIEEFPVAFGVATGYPCETLFRQWFGGL